MAVMPLKQNQGIREFNISPRGMNTKVDVISNLELEQAYLLVTEHHFKYYATNELDGG